MTGSAAVREEVVLSQEEINQGVVQGVRELRKFKFGLDGFRACET
jgi:hypothetical protein